jgi:hypothetical protein
VKVDKMSILMDAQLGGDVRTVAERAGVSISAWLAEAAAARLRKQALAAFLSVWQAKHGKITATELAKAPAELRGAAELRGSAELRVRQGEAPMILDAGALIAVSRNDRAMIARLLVAEEDDEAVISHAMAVAQVWRDERGRQARLARLLRCVEVVSIDEELGLRAGELLGKARTADPVDAVVVLIARDGEIVATSDPAALAHLARAAKRDIRVVRC